MSPAYGYVTKLFLESEFQHKGTKNKKRKKERKREFFFSKILRFSW